MLHAAEMRPRPQSPQPPSPRGLGSSSTLSSSLPLSHSHSHSHAQPRSSIRSGPTRRSSLHRGGWRRIWLPRSVVRTALIVSTILFLLSIYSLGNSGSVSMTPVAGATKSGRSSLWDAIPVPLPRRRPPPASTKAAHPSTPHSRMYPNMNRAQPLHPGVSRTEIVSRPGTYRTEPLPSLRQAFAHLYPVLNAIKDATPAVPREHNLGAPVFPPFIPAPMKERYAHLAPEFDDDGFIIPGTERRILMVAVCRQVAGMLSDWFATWTVLADFLGPESLVISLMEGQSDDGSGELIAGALRDHLLFIGVPPENIFVTTHTPELHWNSSHRIELLARMRNDVMAPIFESDTPHLAPDGKPWSAVVWHNDVYFGVGHVLELLHQHETQDADITCGWDHAGKWFYDGWVGRDMSGDLYSPFPVPKEDEGKEAKFFPSSPFTKERHSRMLPYQVFSGWNGMLVISPIPFAPPYNVRFRRGIPRTEDQREGEEECQSSESMFISWDFWRYGFGRILTVPGVHLTYGKGDARTRGWVDLPRPEKNYPERVHWDDEPPAKIRCHDWPEAIGKNHWAWGSVRWVDAPTLEIPDPNTPMPPPGRKSTISGVINAWTDDETKKAEKGEEEESMPPPESPPNSESEFERDDDIPMSLLSEATPSSPSEADS